MRSLLIPLAVCLGLLIASDALAMRFWWFRITRDGEPTFSGGIGASDRTPPLVVLRGGLHQARIQPSPKSVLTPEELSKGDVTLEGEIEFSFPDLDPVRLPRLRFLHDPEPRRKNQTDGYFDWRLHPDDADAILRLYSASPAPAEPAPASGPVPIIAIVAGGIVVVGLVWLVLRGRGRVRC
jgi:hypothetical protein